MFVISYISLVALASLCFVIHKKLKVEEHNTATNPIFLTFQRKYLVIYLIAVLGDWLQGPYLYRLYHYRGFVGRQIVIIYLCGLVTSAFFAPSKGFLCDRFGRRATAICVCILNSISCLITLSHNYVILIVGRILAGISNSILFQALEIWYLHEHIETNDFPREWVQVTFSLATLGSSLVAVLAGVLADVVAEWASLGAQSPFILAIVFLLATGSLIIIQWSENYGPEKEMSVKKVRMSCSEGLKIIAQNPDVFLVGVTQSLFESVLFVFVFIWTPILNPANPPLGIVFACFMVCYVIGNILFRYLHFSLKTSLGMLLCYTTGLSSVVFLISSYYFANKFPRVNFLSFIIFELCCGVYFPSMREIRKEILPEDHRMSIINWFRVPLTLMSALVLLLFHDTSGGLSEILLFCGVLMAIALLSSLRFARQHNNEPQDEDVVA